MSSKRKATWLLGHIVIGFLVVTKRKLITWQLGYLRNIEEKENLITWLISDLKKEKRIRTGSKIGSNTST